MVGPPASSDPGWFKGHDRVAYPDVVSPLEHGGAGDLGFVHEGAVAAPQVRHAPHARALPREARVLPGDARVVDDDAVVPLPAHGEAVHEREGLPRQGARLHHQPREHRGGSVEHDRGLRAHLRARRRFGELGRRGEDHLEQFVEVSREERGEGRVAAAQGEEEQVKDRPDQEEDVVPHAAGDGCGHGERSPGAGVPEPSLEEGPRGGQLAYHAIGRHPHALHEPRLLEGEEGGPRDPSSRRGRRPTGAAVWRGRGGSSGSPRRRPRPDAPPRPPGRRAPPVPCGPGGR